MKFEKEFAAYYPGDVTDMVKPWDELTASDLKGPNLLNEWFVAKEAIYELKMNRTRVVFDLVDREVVRAVIRRTVARLGE